MSEQLKLRGDTATNLVSFTPAQRECVVDITNNRLCVGDGTTANGWPLAKLSEGAWTISTGVMQCNLSQRAAVTTLPVPTLRPLTSDSVLAFDLMPNGSPAESTNNGFAWLDVCGADVYASNVPELNSARVGITSYGADFGSRAFNGASLEPINFTFLQQGGSLTKAMVITPTYGYVGIGGTTAPDSYLTVNPTGSALGTPPSGTQAHIGAQGLARLTIDGFAGAAQTIYRRGDGTVASPSAVQSGENLGGASCAGYNGSAWTTANAGWAAYAAENWTTGANGAYVSVYATPQGSTSEAEILRVIGNGQIVAFGAQADQSKVDIAPSTGFSQTVANNCTTLLIKPSGTLATGTVIMPAAPVDGQIVKVLSSQTITTLTVSPNSGQSVSGAPTTISASSPFSTIYDLASMTWYRW
jgi:hypothetical protein